VAKNHVTPAIVTLSLGISAGSWSQSLEAAVRALIEEHNVTVITASGNSDVDACTVAPANVNGTIAVAASDLPTKFGRTSAQAMSGPCSPCVTPTRKALLAGSTSEP
jgi:subtilisin family serine protease